MFAAERGYTVVSQESIERTRRIRKRIHEMVPACIAVVDHGEYVGAYVYPEDIEQTEALLSGHDFEGVTIYVRPTPPLTSVPGWPGPTDA